MTGVLWWTAVSLMTIGILLVLRATVLITVKSPERFRGDALVTTFGGIALVLLGQFLLD
ncbi:hypothetical protein Q9S36_47795 [Microbacterium sp. ARD31]|uniref:hypothetical protein n=1 Tax=Microbacterium sp. ARD31 TaxID=2962576 RepID=UPI002882B768|nr:hypothetical protein [Microbacterium sp. ARD31]MDT0187917.1 hypothetical protein [Microbacterium sp. ARD31]